MWPEQPSGRKMGEVIGLQVLGSKGEFHYGLDEKLWRVLNRSFMYSD